MIRRAVLAILVLAIASCVREVVLYPPDGDVVEDARPPDAAPPDALVNDGNGTLPDAAVD